jgi:hypothetical protein
VRDVISFVRDLTNSLRTDAFIARHRETFPWKKWTQLAIQSQIRLSGWPSTLYPVPGNEFKVEELKNHEWKELAQPIIDGSGQHVTITRWTQGGSINNFIDMANDDLEECDLDKDSPKYGKIPLVTSTMGMVLQRVEASLEYQKERAKTHAKSTKSAPVDNAATGRQIKPLPSRTHGMMPPLTANPRPPKRARDESWGEHFVEVDGARRELYTITQDDPDEKEGNYDDDLYHARQTNLMDVQPVRHFYAQHQPDPHVHHRHVHSRAPPSFHDITQGRPPPPSSRPLDRPSFPTSRFHRRAPAHSVVQPSTSQQATPGPSRLGPAEVRHAYYRKKPGPRMLDFNEEWD